MASNQLAPFGGRSLFAGGPFGSLQGEINRLFDEVWKGFEAPEAAALAFTPRIDVAENETGWVVEAELPGLSEADVDVSVQDNVLTIRGEKKSGSERNERNVHVAERSYGRFQRALRLPPGIDFGRIEASFDKGVLKVTVPKAAEAQERTRRIEVKAG